MKRSSIIRPLSLGALATVFYGCATTQDMSHEEIYRGLDSRPRIVEEQEPKPQVSIPFSTVPKQHIPAESPYSGIVAIPASQDISDKINSESFSQKKTDKPEFQKQWYFIVGMNQLYPSLDESEASLDLLQMVGIDPRSFKDMKDEGTLIDVWVQVGRDINEKWTWLVSTGGAYKEIKNHYEFACIDLDVDLVRGEFFVTPEIRYHPFGKPNLELDQDTKRSFAKQVKDSITHARPWVGLAAGITYEKAKGSAVVSGPFGHSLTLQSEDHDHIFAQISPRAGIDFPLTETVFATFALQYYHPIAIPGISEDDFNYKDDISCFATSFSLGWRFGGKKKATNHDGSGYKNSFVHHSQQRNSHQYRRRVR